MIKQSKGGKSKWARYLVACFLVLQKNGGMNERFSKFTHKLSQNSLALIRIKPSDFDCFSIEFGSLAFMIQD